jgi:hypothetical protein
MIKITRNDTFVKSEKGPDWFNEFIRFFCENQKPNSVASNLSDIINNRTVESVVKSYREQVGLDIVGVENEKENNMKIAEEKPTKKFISKRAAKENIILLIESRPDIKEAIESFCRHSGGTKSTHSIINFLRNELGNELVSFTDDNLINYINEYKNKHNEKDQDNKNNKTNVGLVGTDKENSYDDAVADYISHGA